MKMKAIVAYILSLSLLLSACVYRVPDSTQGSSDPALQESEDRQPTENTQPVEQTQASNYCEEDETTEPTQTILQDVERATYDESFVWNDDINDILGTWEFVYFTEQSGNTTTYTNSIPELDYHLVTVHFDADGTGYSIEDGKEPEYFTWERILDNSTRLTRIGAYFGIFNKSDWYFSYVDRSTHSDYRMLLEECGLNTFAVFRKIESLTEPAKPYDEADLVIDGDNYILGPYTFQRTTVTVEDQTVSGWSLVSCADEIEDAVIPATLLGEPVVAIGPKAFYDHNITEYIEVPDTVLVIGDSAFSSCAALEAVIIPEGVKEIGESAFQWSEIESITLPDSLTKLGPAAFYYCFSLQEVKIGSGLKVIESYAFYGCRSITSLTLSEGLQEISHFAFRDCYKLTEVVIPEGTLTLGQQAFHGCEKLTEVVLPSTLVTIDVQAFCLCTSLTKINFPDSLQRIGHGAFEDCPSPTVFRITAGLTGDLPAFYMNDSLTTVIVEEGATSIPIDLPYSVTTLQLSHTMTELRSELLVDTQVKFLEVYEGVTKLGFNVFGNETLESVILPSTLTVIEDDIFWGDNYDGAASSEYVLAPVKQIFFRGTEEQCLQELKDQAAIIEVPIYYYSETQPTEDGNFWHYVDGEPVIYGNEPLVEPAAEEFRIVSIGTRTYRLNAGDYREITMVINGQTVSGLTLYSCYKSVEELIIPEEVYGIPVIAIGNNLSYQNDVFPEPINQDIKRVVIPETVLYIGDYAFSNCPNLTDLTIPSSVKWIDECAFAYSYVPQEFRITADMKVTENAFHDAMGLERVIIEEGVTYIPSFYYCESLTEINLPSTAKRIGEPAYMNFIDNTSVKFLEIPEGVLYLGFYLFSGSSLESIILPSTILDVKRGAFLTDTLKYVYFHGTEEQCCQDILVELARTDATIYYYSETRPTGSGNYWHYVDGKPVIWRSNLR